MVVISSTIEYDKELFNRFGIGLCDQIWKVKMKKDELIK